MARLVDKSDQVTKGGYAVGGIWTTAIIGATIYIGVGYQFYLWWILIILSIANLLTFIFYILITKKILDQVNLDKNIKYILILSFINLIVLNIPLFAYCIIGTLFYRKAFYTL